MRVKLKGDLCMARKAENRHASGLVEVKITIGKTLDGKPSSKIILW